MTKGTSTALVGEFNEAITESGGGQISTDKSIEATLDEIDARIEEGIQEKERNNRVQA